MKKNLVITGGTSGIGRAMVEELLKDDWEVTILARNKSAAADIASNGGSLRFIPCDLFQPASIREAEEEIRRLNLRIDVLANNAGAWFMSHGLTKEGNERAFALNHLSHFFLTRLLLDLLLESKSRVINVSSNAHLFARLNFSDLNWTRRRYRVFQAYGASKLANIHFTEALHRRYSNEGLTAFALHPGVVASNFGHSTGGIMSILFGIAKPFFLSNQAGARTQIHLARTEGVEIHSGQYFYRARPKKPARYARDPEISDHLWEVSEKLTQEW